MKIAILNDTHFGARNDSEAFRNYQLKFFNDIFFPYLKKHNIKTVVHLGDVVDRRKFINFETASTFKEHFWDRLWKEKLDTHIIIGNHDTYFKNTNEVNAVENLYTSFDGKNEPWIYTRPKIVTFDDLPILFMPWICDDTREESMHLLDSAPVEIVMGHLEIKGVEMSNGFINEFGNEKSDFKRFERVISGHFHKHSNDGQIYYCGAQYEQTWSDYKDPKGFNIFDTETRELTRIKNPYTIHKKLIYDDVFDRLIERLYTEINVHDLTIVEDYSDIKASVSENILEMGEDTVTFLNNYVDQLDTKIDKNKLKEYLKSIYIEASNHT